MAIEGAYEEDGMVVIEFNDGPPARISWKEALERCQGVSIAEQKVSAGRRSPGIQRAIEQILGAAVAARKKDPGETGWTPPPRMSMFQPGNKAEVAKRKSASNSGLIIPD